MELIIALSVAVGSLVVISVGVWMLAADHGTLLSLVLTVVWMSIGVTLLKSQVPAEVEKIEEAAKLKLIADCTVMAERPGKAEATFEIWLDGAKVHLFKCNKPE